MPTFCDYQVELPRKKDFTIPNVPLLVCDQCGDKVSGEEGSRYINAAIDKALNVISPVDLQQFLAKYSLTQKEAARITGYGEKSFSRWTSGKSRPSESVSDILRRLLADEAAFERLRQRSFSPLPTEPLDSRSKN